MKRRTPLKRTGWIKRKAPRRLAKRSAFAPVLAFVRGLPCVSCSKSGPSDAAHVVTGRSQRGMGIKCSDAQTVPLCRICHRAFDTHSGQFRGWSREQRYEIANRWLLLVELEMGTTRFERAA